MFFRRGERYLVSVVKAGIATIKVMKRTDADLIPLKGSNKKENHRAIKTGFKRGVLSMDINPLIRSNFFFQIFTEKAFGFDKQYDDEDDEGVCILVFTRYITCSQALDETE